MDSQEQVLVVERAVLEEEGMFDGVCFDVKRYVRRMLTRGVPRYVDRGPAEQDPGLKQLIPYVIMRCGDRVLSYVRGKRGGETRLIGRRSIGIGGHINPVDDAAPLFETDDLTEVYFAAVRREVEEEVDVACGFTDSIVALINDDSTEVGRVHLGVVHLWDLEHEAVTKREQMITQMGFVTREQLEAEHDTLETWSQLCLDHLDKFTSEDATAFSASDVRKLFAGS